MIAWRELPPAGRDALIDTRLLNHAAGKLCDGQVQAAYDGILLCPACGARGRPQDIGFVAPGVATHRRIPPPYSTEWFWTCVLVRELTTQQGWSISVRFDFQGVTCTARWQGHTGIGFARESSNAPSAICEAIAKTAIY